MLRKKKIAQAREGKHFKEISDEEYHGFIMVQQDQYELLTTLTKPEAWLFNLLMKTWDKYTGQAILHYSSLTNSERTAYKKVIKTLATKELLIKIHTGMYLINPQIIYTLHWKESLLVWAREFSECKEVLDKR